MTIEYLVKRTDGEWFQFPAGSDPFRPTSTKYRKIEGWGDGRIEVLGCEVSFSYEDPGVQICFEGEISDQLAQSIAEEVMENIQLISGQSARLVRIT